jgi:hypothetical protein
MTRSAGLLGGGQHETRIASVGGRSRSLAGACPGWGVGARHEYLLGWRFETACIGLDIGRVPDVEVDCLFRSDIDSKCFGVEVSKYLQITRLGECADGELESFERGREETGEAL